MFVLLSQLKLGEHYMHQDIAMDIGRQDMSGLRHASICQ